MITLKFNSEHSFHSEWEELIRDEALKIFSIIRRLENNEIELNIAQAEFFMHVAGLHIPKEKREGLFWENIYQASSMFRFFFKYVYQDERFKNLSKETKTLLEKYLPIELADSPEIRVASKIKPEFAIDCIFGRNLIEYIKIGKKIHRGYTFINQNGFIQTSLTAQQYVDAVAVSNKYATDTNPEELNMLVAILYGPDPEKAFDLQEYFSKLDLDTKYAIWRNFRAICDWIAKKTHFSILWGAKPAENKPSNTVGGIIYSVSKAGYGSPDQVGKLNLMKLLEIMKQIIIDNIRAMKDAKIKLPEIAEKTGLPLNIIIQYI